MTLAVCGFTACAGDLSRPERFSFLLDGGADGASSVSPPPACVTDFFENSCDSPVCHGAASSVLDLVSPGVASRLIDRPASAEAACAGGTLVSTDGSSSLLLEKLTTPTCGEKMPFGGAAAQPAEIDCVRDWIESLGAGAADDGGAVKSDGRP